MADAIATQRTVYHALETPSSIRLLRLHKNSESPHKLRADLGVFDISHQQCPPFTTVSYTWGHGTSNEPISLNGHDRRVLKSLMPLLRMLCSDDNQDYELAEHWFWIDSICINQADLFERAAQVKLMTSIYQKAQDTLVWLAEGSQDTDRAIDFLRILRDKRHDLRQPRTKRRVRCVPEDLVDHPGWGSLERLLQRPWWRRVWTLQEFIIPENLRFYCGPKSISRLSFRQGMSALELCGPLDEYIQEHVCTTAWNRRRIMEWYHNEHQRHKIPLVSLMASCGDHYASDDQDRVWAVHGLARQEDRDMIGPPTYQHQVKTLYAWLVKSFVDKYGSLDIICYAQIFTNCNHDDKDSGWPSWVPDWRVEVPHPSVVPLMVSQSSCPQLANLRPPKAHGHPSLLRTQAAQANVSYRASGDPDKTLRRVTFCESPTHLTCQGIKLDVIDGLGTSQGDYQISAATTSPVNTTTVIPAGEGGGRDDEAMEIRKSALYSLARSMVLDRRDQFLERGAPARQYLRELKLLGTACAAASAVRGRSGTGSSRPPDWASSVSRAVPKWFRGWWRDNNRAELRIRGFTLEELCQADEPGFNPMPGTIQKTSKSFYARFRGTMKAAPRRLMVTQEGRVGMAPRQAGKGDVICVLLGCSVPVVLRPYRGAEDKDEDLAGLYEFIGECYVDGFMNGEALVLGKPVEDFTLR